MPSRMKFLRFANFSIVPQNTLFITDTADDVLAGNQAGVVTVALAQEYSYNTLDMLKISNPHHLLTNIRQISELIERLK